MPTASSNFAPATLIAPTDSYDVYVTGTYEYREAERKIYAEFARTGAEIQTYVWEVEELIEDRLTYDELIPLENDVTYYNWLSFEH